MEIKLLHNMIYVYINKYNYIDNTEQFFNKLIATFPEYEIIPVFEWR